MRRMTQVTALAAVAFIGAVSSHAYSATGELESSKGVAAPPPSAEAQQQIDKGDERAAERRYASARSYYRKAVELTRAEGLVADVALRRVANTFYFQGKYNSAATALQELARDASEAGELELEAWALADAAWMHARSGAVDANSREEEWRRWEGGRPHVGPLWHREHIDTERVLVRLERLLESRYLDDDVRDEIRQSRLADLQTLTSR